MQSKETVVAVECCACGSLHKQEALSYITIAGNIYIGANGGVVGNNLDDEGKVTRSTYCCSKMSCLDKLFLNEVFRLKNTHLGGMV